MSGSGYMPPEYVIDGIFSMKSDIYSFGVLVLEIVSRQRNRCFEHPDHSLNLLGHVSAHAYFKCLLVAWTLVSTDITFIRYGDVSTKRNLRERFSGESWSQAANMKCLELSKSDYFVFKNIPRTDRICHL